MLVSSKLSSMHFGGRSHSFKCSFRTHLQQALREGMQPGGQICLRTLPLGEALLTQTQQRLLLHTGQLDQQAAQLGHNSSVCPGLQAAECCKRGSK